MGLSVLSVERKKRELFKKKELRYKLLKILSYDLRVSKSIKKKSSYLLKKFYLKKYKSVCIKTHRIRGVLSYWGVSRMVLKKIVSTNFVVGLHKRSW